MLGILNGVKIQEGFTEEVKFEQKPEGGNGAGHGEDCPGRGRSQGSSLKTEPSLAHVNSRGQ